MVNRELLLAVLLFAFSQTDACTAIGVTPGASVDGSVFVSHSSDAEGSGDPRLWRVEAKTHTGGAMRPVYEQAIGLVERVTPPRLLGYVPQPNATFAYMREAYGAINEKQLVLGESTTSALAPVDGWAKARGLGGHALFGIQPLTMIALERCASARCAVETMGQLAEQYGFYQDEGTPTGEAIVAGDTKEVWVFHVLPDPTGKSAVWAAAKVEDGHVVVVSNMFVIREMDLSNTDRFLGSANLLEVAKKYGGWDDSQPLDFTRIFSDPAHGGEYGGQYYTGRRVWRAYSLLAPEAKLSPVYSNLAKDAPYPVSVRVAPRSITGRHVMRVHRDFLEGTQFDLTKGVAAGPWGTPHRFAFPADPFPRWERPISIYRCAGSYVAQARGWLPDAVGGTIWFGPHVPHGTLYVPFAVGMPSLPLSYSGYDMLSLDRRAAYWAHVGVETLAEARFKWIRKEVEAMQERMENHFSAVQAAADKAYARTGDLGMVYTANANWVTDQLWRFHDALLYRYADGYIRATLRSQPALTYEETQLSPAGMGYPEGWLEAVGYSDSDGQAPPGGALPHKSAPPQAQMQPDDVVPLADSLADPILAAFARLEALTIPTDEPAKREANSWLDGERVPLVSMGAGLLVGFVVGAALMASEMRRREWAPFRGRDSSRWKGGVSSACGEEDSVYLSLAADAVSRS